MQTKPLVINSKENPGSGVVNKWSVFDSPEKFVEHIQTAGVSEKINISSFVSGIPTAFARVDLFRNALEYFASASDNEATKSKSIIALYKQIADEWKGLIACIALDYAHISVKKINLEYTDGKTHLKTANVYEPKGAFGNMLLRRRKLWEPQATAQNASVTPFINVIKYHGQVVGATAPECLVFTSTGYRCQAGDDQPWINPRTGKFTDPVRTGMTDKQTATLYKYVGHLIKGIRGLEAYYEALPAHLTAHFNSIRIFLTKWQNEIEYYAESENYKVDNGTIPAVDAEFSAPFDAFFCHQDILYGLEGQIFDKEENNAIRFEPKHLLLDEKAQPAQLRLHISKDDLSKLPILVMTAEVKGTTQEMYFSLPLSALGLNVFGRNVASLVDGSNKGNRKQSSLRAVYDPNPNLKTGNLEVTLNLVANDGIERPVKKVYTSINVVENKDILIWPNFISPQWTAYYMYSELPHNERTDTYRAFPFVGTMQNGYFRILVDEKDNSPILLSENGRIVAGGEEVKAELLIKSDEEVGPNEYRYEIYKSNQPFKGVRLLSPSGQEGGYLLINYSTVKDSLLPRDLMDPNDVKNLTPVRLGVDFGSTNTSVAYSTNDGEKGFTFKNQRVSLMGNELPGKPVMPRANQVLFFQGYGAEIEANAIKSVLTIHDSKRLRKLEQGETPKNRDGREVVGGFPSFAENLPFADSSKDQILLKFKDPATASEIEVRQINNMKWGERDEDISHKSAFLRTLLLHVYANLFEKDMVPTLLKWSYPSAMKGERMGPYKEIWKGLEHLIDVYDPERQRYQLAVSDYVQTLGGDMSNDFDDDSDFGTGDSGSGSDFSDDSIFSDDSAFSSGSDFDDSGFFESGSDFNTGSSLESTPKKEAAPAATKQPRFFTPDDPEEKVVYNPGPIYKVADQRSLSLSEAEAVANFVKAKGSSDDQLYITFDVGGSTTDISALFYLYDKASQQPVLTMVKQNSIRFAAQRVSDIVGRFPKFKNVLSEVCAQFGIKMAGLNMPPDSYNERTASYYFNQIVNKLKGDQLDVLYRKINADCPRLMVVDLYVTGLLMFYAGELANKLVSDLLKTGPEEWKSDKRRPHVIISFAGKGSRLFQWLPTAHQTAADEYYRGMFVRGYGVEKLKATLKRWPEIHLPGTNDEETKYEVSKGLARGETDLYTPRDREDSEIVGEAGFAVVGEDHKSRPVEFTNSLTPAMISQIGFNFKQADSAMPKKFTEFCSYFYKAAKALCGWQVNPKVLEQACKNLNVTGYIQNMREFRNASDEVRNDSTASFDFVVPIIIAEGMKFYDDSLLKLI